MARFSIPFNCRKYVSCAVHVSPCVLVLILCSRCHHSGFVDRQDLEAQSEIHCPFPACDHVWCQKCQQTIEPGGPKHSCDGTSELDHLMKQQGWRYCPSELDLLSHINFMTFLPYIDCKSPIQKTQGCNHLSVRLPFGCDMTQILMEPAVAFSVLRPVVIHTFVIAVVRRSTELPFLGKYRKANRLTFVLVLSFRAHICWWLLPMRKSVVGYCYIDRDACISPCIQTCE